ncbi:type II toxin-antitoxin system HigB family toxin [Nostoc sp. UCD121]|nr:type II toxin-antitoxin system HigB family toxin [Nostoc sp. UCD120]MBC1276177.1 type II toxin-antitoxin system HigB family toxin [Nostoc sp. UCD121]MBC1293982.1 type II toxin-antitoxin system HigB family toxin [Nostoc sp. UCD122]
MEDIRILTHITGCFGQGCISGVRRITVFNIKGNKYRLIVDIRYSSQTIFIKYVLTHPEYDKERWKDDPYF